MKSKLIACLMTGALLLQAPLAVAQAPKANVMYVRPAKAAVRSGPGTADPILVELRAGEAVTILSAQGVRSRVRTASGKEGFVLRTHLVATAPSAGGQLVLRDSTRPGQMSGAGTTRGLAPVSEEYAKLEGASEASVTDTKKMEQVADSVTAEQVEEFRREGGIEAP
jgi:uncharacterized protein YgiM (DUF1202 family)